MGDFSGRPKRGISSSGPRWKCRGRLFRGSYGNFYFVTDSAAEDSARDAVIARTAKAAYQESVGTKK
jgi:hypothetical protein